MTDWNHEQVKSVIRSTADRMADAKTGEQRRRIKSKQDSQEKYRRAHERMQHRYQSDPAALLTEHSWACSFCDAVHPPAVYDDPVHEGHVLVIRKERCGCPAEVEAEQQAAQEADKARRSFNCAEWVINLSRTGLTDWLALATFDTFNPENAQQAGYKRQVLDYCADLLSGGLGRRSWLILHGNYGTGKTHLAAAVLHEAMAQGLQCRFRVWPQWIERLQGTFGGKGDSGAVVNELKSGQVVVLDDLDNQHPTEWTQEKLYTALNFRYNGNKPTILTFNHTPTEMAAWLGPAVTDRMLERAYACVSFEGASHRSGKTW
jgi:DNA replication protein DnaC